MLLLSRREGEAIMIADEIKIQVISVSERAGSVRIGIEAPDTVTVQSTAIEREAPVPKSGPVITHKPRKRVLTLSE